MTRVYIKPPIPYMKQSLGLHYLITNRQSRDTDNIGNTRQTTTKTQHTTENYDDEQYGYHPRLVVNTGVRERRFEISQLCKFLYLR